MNIRNFCLVVLIAFVVQVSGLQAFEIPILSFESTGDHQKSVSSQSIFDKILTARTHDGMRLNVHYQEALFKRIEDRVYPYKVLNFMTKSYETLTRDMGFDGAREMGFDRIDLYLVDTEGHQEVLLGGVGQEDFKRAPLFVIQREPSTGAKSPAILMPMKYRQFLKKWEKMNRVPLRRERDVDSDLAGSIMHEMTHAVLHAYHENLGSTEYRIRNGDWYTEGLARYYETKTGSDSGFASQGFRKKMKDKIQFSRGGANYYLKFPDQSFFSLRYENALFWLYFEKKFGTSRVVGLTRRFKEVPFGASAEQYIALLEEVTTLDFGALLNGYFNWVYREDYKSFRECVHLLEVSKTRSVWTRGELFLISPFGNDLEISNKLNTDWISRWGDQEAQSFSDFIAGDGTKRADIEPLAFDVHEIWSGGSPSPGKIIIKNKGPSQHVVVTLYVYGPKGIRTFRKSIPADEEIIFSGLFPKSLSKLGIVLSNLDVHRPCEYEIQIH